MFFRLACGIVARSSGLFQNPKQICACDGLTLWDERDRNILNQETTNSSTNDKICAVS